MIPLVAALTLAAAGAGPFEAPSPKIVIQSEVEDREVDRWRSACTEVAVRLGAGRGPWRITLRRAPTVAAFAERTGRGRFEAAAVVADTIWIQPAHVLDRIPGAEAIRRHECVHAYLRHLGVPPLDHALEEAVAAGLSGQAGRLPAGRNLDRAGLARASQILRRPRSSKELQASLQDVVTTLWPRLRSLEGPRLVERLKLAGRSEDWVSVVAPGFGVSADSTGPAGRRPERSDD